MSYFNKLVELGDQLSELVRVHSEWSQETFGPDCERGPIGPLRHLAKEVQEALTNPDDVSEYADLLILVLDASRRAGIKIMPLLQAANAKMAENRQRKWPKYVPWEYGPATAHNVAGMVVYTVTATRGVQSVSGAGGTAALALDVCLCEVRRLMDDPVEHIRE